METDKNGRVTGALYFDGQRNVHLQKAKAVILSANGAETPRLLLLSVSNQFPAGLANSSGYVGKNLMPNSGAIAFGVFDEQLNDYKGPAVSRIMHDFYELDPKLGLYGGAGVDARFEFTPPKFVPHGGLPGTATTGAGVQQTIPH